MGCNTVRATRATRGYLGANSYSSVNMGFNTNSHTHCIIAKC